MRIGIRGISLKACDDIIVVSSSKELRILSSAPLNGGMTRSMNIVNHHVRKDFHTLAPEQYLQRLLRKKNLEENTVGLMTAADMRNISIVNGGESRIPFSVVITAGTSNAMTAGDSPHRFRGRVGTINAIILLDANPTDACLVEIVKVVTEAKVLALRQHDILSKASDQLATGTSTDTVTVAATGRGKPLRFAGTGTPIGSAISRVVTYAVKDAIRKQDGISVNRTVAEKLKERGITVDRVMVEVARRLPTGLRRKLLIRSEASVQRILKSSETASLILASLKMFEDNSPNGNSTLLAKGIGSSIAYLIGGELGRSRFKVTCSSQKRPFIEFLLKGIASGVIANIIKEFHLKK
jgi:adenosylcobinamide amidohydrolase